MEANNHVVSFRSRFGTFSYLHIGNGRYRGMETNLIYESIDDIPIVPSSITGRS